MRKRLKGEMKSNEKWNQMRNKMQREVKWN